MKIPSVTLLLLSLLVSEILAASDVHFLFDKALQLRRGSKERRSRILFKNRPSNNMEMHVRLQRALHVGLNQQELHLHNRKLQFCTFASVAEGSCTVQEWCNDIEGISGSKCSGDLAGEWQLSSETGEVCFYLDEAQDQGPFDESKFNPDTDFCGNSAGIFSLIGAVPQRSELVYEITRPEQGRQEQTNAMEPCDKTLPDVVFDGFCETCSVMEIEGKACNSCTSCPEDSVGDDLLDCSNVFSSMVATCDVEDGIYAQFSEYMGVVCSFNAVTAGRCSLDKFCSQLDGFGESFEPICSGDVTEGWSIQLHEQEVCYFGIDDAEGMPYDEATFDSATDFCEKSGLILNFEAGVLSTEDTYYEITRPTEAQGRASDVLGMIPCEENFEYQFGVGYCSLDCAAVTIGGVACIEDCTVCPDGRQVMDCSNVDSTLVESCSLETDDDLTEELLAYFRVEHQVDPTDTPSEAPQASPAASSTAPFSALLFVWIAALLAAFL
jgi:hypothetical protein